MTEYPFDFGNGYKIQTVFANKTTDNVYGDIYDFRADAEREHPDAEIMTGYCVIAESSGTIPEGCNSWNDTISDALQDYEEHVIPVLEREEDIELNCTELDPNGNPVRETLFSVKSGWLQEYFDVDDRCQLEALMTNSDDWDPVEILKDARKEPDLSGLVVGEITEFEHISKQSDVSQLGNSVFLDWSVIDQALDKWAKSYFGTHVSAQGSRDETDFEIELLCLRPSDYVKFEKLFEAYDTDHDYDPDSEFETDPHASILPVVISRGVMYEALPLQGLTGYGTAIATYDGVFLMEYTREQKEPVTKNRALETNEIVKNLIHAMAEYGLDGNWTDNDIIDALVNVGITQKDFQKSGYEDFVKDYFEDDREDYPSLDSRIQSASGRTIQPNLFSTEKGKTSAAQITANHKKGGASI